MATQMSEMPGWKEIILTRDTGCARALASESAVDPKGNKINDRIYCWGDVFRNPLINKSLKPYTSFTTATAVLGRAISYTLPGKFIRF